MSSVGCSCNGKVDLLGNGDCKSGAKPWCYVNRDANCDDQENYNGKFISFLACSANTGSDTNRKTSSGSIRLTTTRRPSPPRTTRQPSPPRTTRRPSASSSSGSDQCEYMCIDDKGNCHTTYVGPPRRGNKRGTCLAKTSFCSRIPKECKKCNEVLSC